jgi:FkbM family methyltransferase
MNEKMKRMLSNIRYLFLINPKLSVFIKNVLLVAFCGKVPDKLVFKDGLILQAPYNHPLLNMISEIYYQKVYTPNRNFEIKSKDVVLDIGANIGIFTVLAANRTKNKVYAFEPYQQNYYYLSKNILVNNLLNVIPNKMAVSDNVGYKNLLLMNNPAGHVLENKNFSKVNKNYVEVYTTTLKEYIDTNNIEQIDYLKMDCEGSEGEILSSIPKKYFKKIQKIVIEFHDNVSFLKHNEIIELLNNVNFSTRVKWDQISPFGFIYAHK